MKYEISPMHLQGRKKFLIEETLLDFVLNTLDQFAELDPKYKQGRKQWANRCLATLAEAGYAEAHRDEDGNLVFLASATLLSETGKELGPLKSRDDYLTD